MRREGNQKTTAREMKKNCAFFFLYFFYLANGEKYMFVDEVNVELREKLIHTIEVQLTLKLELQL